MPIQRLEHNPIIRPQDVEPTFPDWEVLCEHGLVKIYYGASDTFTAYAQLPLEEILDGLE